MSIDRECGSKQGYLTKHDAKRVARLMTGRHGTRSISTRARHCRLWHVGHLVPAPLRAAVQRFPTRRAWQVEAWSA